MVFERDAYSLDDIEVAEETWGKGSLTKIRGFP
jgi:hypothetical protein